MYKGSYPFQACPSRILRRLSVQNPRYTKRYERRWSVRRLVLYFMYARSQCCERECQLAEEDIMSALRESGISQLVCTVRNSYREHILSAHSAHGMRNLSAANQLCILTAILSLVIVRLSEPGLEFALPLFFLFRLSLW